MTYLISYMHAGTGQREIYVDGISATEVSSYLDDLHDAVSESHVGWQITDITVESV